MSQHGLAHPNWIKMESPVPCNETCPLPARGLLSPGSGKGPCLAMQQEPASLAPTSHAPTPLLPPYFQAPVQAILGVHSTIFTSLCTPHSVSVWNWSSIKSLEKVYKAHLIWGQRSSPHQCSSPHLYKKHPWGSPKEKERRAAQTPIAPLMAPKQHLSLP